MTDLAAYTPTLLAAGLVGLLLVIQLLVADLLAIRAKHPPGHPIAPDHGSLLFRASRAHANTNESVAAFVLFAAFSIGMGAHAGWLNALAWGYLAARAAYMLCYYANWRTARSAIFGVSVIALLGMFVTGAVAAV